MLAAETVMKHLAEKYNVDVDEVEDLLNILLIY